MKTCFDSVDFENNHKDPFDRLLIAQSRSQNISIVTSDTKFNLYDVNIIW